MVLIDRTEATAGVTTTRNGRNIYSRGNPRARRDPSRIDAIILHQTDFVSDRIERFDYVIANYIVMQDGRALHVRPIDHALNSVGTDRHGIDIEIVGRYPSVNGRGRVSSGALPPIAQIKAARELVSRLALDRILMKIFGHVQFRQKNCPGPHLWRNVGEWAIENLHLSSSGRGRPIPEQWRSDSLMI